MSEYAEKVRRFKLHSHCLSTAILQNYLEHMQNAHIFIFWTEKTGTIAAGDLRIKTSRELRGQVHLNYGAAFNVK